MNITDIPEKALLRMTVGEGTVPEQLNAAAALIRWLPGVLRVGVDLATRQFEILFVYPTKGLLHEIYDVMHAANSEIVALKVY